MEQEQATRVAHAIAYEQETLRLADSAMAEGMFEAAIRQATEANRFREIERDLIEAFGNDQDLANMATIKF